MLIENCAVLKSSDISREGRSTLNLGNAKTSISAYLDNETSPPFAVITIGSNEPQTIELEWLDLTFGRTLYFKCPCGYRARHLYLTPGAAKLLCRHCCHLKYELSQINRNSPQGKLFYSTNRIIKLAGKRENMRRIFYAGTYTTRYRRFLKLCRQAGLDQVVNDANDLLNAIKAH